MIIDGTGNLGLKPAALVMVVVNVFFQASPELVETAKLAGVLVLRLQGTEESMVQIRGVVVCAVTVA